jgi:hypothetical protein
MLHILISRSFCECDLTCTTCLPYNCPVRIQFNDYDNNLSLNDLMVMIYNYLKLINNSIMFEVQVHHWLTNIRWYCERSDRTYTEK